MQAIQPRIPETQEGNSNGKEKFPVEIFAILGITSMVVFLSENCEKRCSTGGNLEELKVSKDYIFVPSFILICRFCRLHKPYPPTCKIALLILKVFQQQELSSLFSMHAISSTYSAV